MLERFLFFFIIFALFSMYIMSCAFFWLLACCYRLLFVNITSLFFVSTHAHTETLILVWDSEWSSFVWPPSTPGRYQSISIEDSLLVYEVEAIGRRPIDAACATFQEPLPAWAVLFVFLLTSDHVATSSLHVKWVCTQFLLSRFRIFSTAHIFSYRFCVLLTLERFFYTVGIEKSAHCP